MHISMPDDIPTKGMTSHWTDSRTLLKKPMIFTEFGKSSKDPGFNIASRDSFLNAIYSNIYSLAEVEELEAAWFGNLWLKE
ncbi:Mannan endo-1,4-beta-mannosidase 2 [Sesamum angolense]|uniref:Mannan endo-1,4-beta-mannosidase 2 n=1 Tax=Sesamum angolense TaxID=2727404 RepID=A0AAE1WNF7_9LAMI|nr:Mannan endo-1,4-beta-mannosidase 2 [Sesamum angolense]